MNHTDFINFYFNKYMGKNKYELSLKLKDFLLRHKDRIIDINYFCVELCDYHSPHDLYPDFSRPENINYYLYFSFLVRHSKFNFKCEIYEVQHKYYKIKKKYYDNKKLLCKILKAFGL